MNRSLSRGKSGAAVSPVLEMVSRRRRLRSLKIWLHLPFEFFDRDIAHQALAVNEEGRGRFDVQDLGGAITHALDAVQHLLILEAAIEAFLSEAGLFGNVEKRSQGIRYHPVALRAEQQVDDGEILVAGTVSQHERASRQWVERKFPEDVADLAGIDVALFQLRKGLGLKLRTVRTRHRGILDDGDGGVGRSQYLVPERAGRCQVGLSDLCLSPSRRDGGERQSKDEGGNPEEKSASSIQTATFGVRDLPNRYRVTSNMATPRAAQQRGGPCRSRPF